ncbi:hypothetical protein BCR32DRAFT_292311 [Anaeromyces robustus]|uniref:Uncharacterized protein n=1 Tax=Anaeromyces robustus TaxID=1754192 RepID=A0A1Y1XAZ6_9FUNG|nr:hypothetical protein BCR32DRAFT_292311 [Anaeromyces robustus]|eukprot:ORX82920.1 hypothetical protein BCR32DRAFT_292311 [Anaeromyces robustus]
MEFKTKNKKYQESVEELAVIFSNIYDKLNPILAKNEKEILEYIGEASLPKKQRLVKNLQTKIIYCPSEIVEIRNCAVEILNVLITDSKTIKKFVNIIIKFGKMLKEGTLNLYDLIYNSNEYINSEDTDLAEKIKTYILIESEYIDLILEQRIKLPARHVMISELFYQTILLINEFSKDLALESSRVKSSKEYTFDLSVRDTEADILKWNLMSTKGNHYMQYLKNNLDKPLDNAMKDVIVAIAKDNKYSTLLLFSPYSKLIKEYITESKAFIPYEILEVISSSMIDYHVKDFDYEICQLLLNKIIGTNVSEQATDLLENRAAATLLRTMGNIIIGSEEACEKVLNTTNFMEIITEMIKKGAQDNKSSKWFNEQFINNIISVFRVVACIKLNKNFAGVLESSGCLQALKEYENCPNKYIQQYAAYVQGDIKNIPKAKVNINVEPLEVIDLELMPINDQFQLRTSLINAANECMNVPLISEDYYNVTPCDGDGVVIFSGIEKTDNSFAFIGIIVNIFTKEIHDSTYHECSSINDANVFYVNEYANLRKHWGQISRNDALKLLSSLYNNTKVVPGRNGEQVAKLLGLFMNEMPLEDAYTEILNLVNEGIDKSALKPYAWWREFLGSEFNYKIQFKYNDIIYNDGYVRPRYYRNTSNTANDVPNNPDSYVRFWVSAMEKNTKFSQQPFYSRMFMYLLHTLLYVSGIQNKDLEFNIDDLKNTLRNTYLDLMENYKNGNSIQNNALFEAMIERTLVLEPEEELIVPTELYMIFSGTQNNLQLPIEGILRKANRLIPVESRIKNEEIKELKKMLLSTVKNMYINDTIDIQSIYNDEKVYNYIKSIHTDENIAKQFFLNTLVLLNAFIKNVKHLIFSASFDNVEQSDLIQLGFQGSGAFI